MGSILETWRKDIVLVDKGDNPSESEAVVQGDQASFLGDMEDMKCLLRFSSQLLKNSINKEVYNSASVSWNVLQLHFVEVFPFE